MGKELAYLGTPYQRIIKYTPVNLLPPALQVSYPLGRLDVLKNVYVLPEITIVGRV